MSIQAKTLVCPGDIIYTHEGSGLEKYEAGLGVYRRDNLFVASLVGKVIITDTEMDGSSSTVSGGKPKQTIHVITQQSNSADELVINVSDIVLCRVCKLSVNQTGVDILSVGDRELRQPAKGIIRREDVRVSEIDKIIMHECFRPGDLVRASVISLGDSRQYFLSTADVELGVKLARSSNGSIMVPVSWKEMEDPITKLKEFRKVAKPR